MSTEEHVNLLMRGPSVGKQKPVIIRYPSVGGPVDVPGYIVPDTDDLLGVDMRVESEPELMLPADWRITHLPSGFAVNKGDYTSAETLRQAFEIAQRFYQEMKALGSNLTTAVAEDITKEYRKLTQDAASDFWWRVAGWQKPKQEPKQEPKHG